MNEERLAAVERELELIRQRNLRVEADKAWEVSSFRIGTICTLTYFVAATTLCLLGHDRYWLNAIIPTLGFLLSAQSLPLVKQWWIRVRCKPKQSG